MPRRFIRFYKHLSPAIIWETVIRSGEQRLTGLSSEIAYNAILALFPAILAIFTAIGLFSPLEDRFQELMGRLSQIVPIEAFQLIDNFAAEVSRGGNGSLFSVSFIVAIWIASGAISAAMRAIDEIYCVPSPQRQSFWRAKLVSLGLTGGALLLLVVATFLIFISDILLGVLLKQAIIQRDLIEQIALSTVRFLSLPMALGLMAIAFAFLYRFGTSQFPTKTPLLPGAALASVSWAIISRLFRLYVARFGNYNKVYGAVGAVIVLLLWLYMSSLVMLIGAQLNVIVGESMQGKPMSRINWHSKWLRRKFHRR
ncbi:MAG: YihY/virulence factor BrkB family protein [Elainellaceae cyanobacterium]